MNEYVMIDGGVMNEALVGLITLGSVGEGYAWCGVARCHLFYLPQSPALISQLNVQFPMSPARCKLLRRSALKQRLGVSPGHSPAAYLVSQLFVHCHFV